MKIAIACGLSGGHIFPGIALAYELTKKSGNDILMVTSRKKLDIEIFEKSGLRFEAVPYNPFILTLNPVKQFLFVLRLVRGVNLSVKVLSRFRPQCVVGFGGSVSVPILFAAWILHIPRIIHEQNIIAGLANRLVSLFADRIAVSFEETKRFFNERKVVVTGNPVRRKFLNLDKIHSRDRFGLDKERFTIFVIGGSQGAAALNNAVLDALGMMDYQEKKTLQVIHIAGRDAQGPVTERYQKENIKSRIFSFLDEIDRAYTACDLVISRAGATTIAELAHFERPSILVPYPKRRVHQAENAYFLSDNKAAITIEEKDLNPVQIKNLILDLKKDKKRLEDMASRFKGLGVRDADLLLAREVLSLGEPTNP
ncbi:MAG: undecaprenyldiphospho-muramoylpentapeptide beta-N-acetylglucosaminyltransferase [Candidatus Omnitrophica bacterium]|nr:undecaprenyldiphospho-muramoylpentapeptide beta-N-acetylglucosaminyltransferase [Candidatus Omnitrophota bacterium]